MSKSTHIEEIYSTGTTGKQVVLKGIPSSSGITIGKARIIHQENLIVPEESKDTSNVDEEIARFQNVLTELSLEYEELLEKVKNERANIISIIESNALIIKDPMLVNAIENTIKNGYSAESAISQEFDKQKQFFRFSKDDFLKDRAIELDHIKKRMLSSLKYHYYSYSVAKDAIVIAQSITPTDLINFKNEGALAFVTEVGGIASHMSIMARSYELPAVIGLKDATSLIDHDTTVIVDGYSGHVVINPLKSAIAKYITRRKEFEEHRLKLGEIAKLPCETSDGIKIDVRANVSSTQDIHSATMVGAKGSGLVRTESLIIKLNSFPNEEEQYQWYSELAQSAYPSPLTIRAFDIGSDKFSEGIPHHEDNPALGLRGIRYLLSRKNLFKSQIKAVLRASQNKNIKFMIPMVSCLPEVIKTLDLISECKNELDAEGKKYDPMMPFGVMIETPAAALISEQIAPLVDFFSIGTNDLTQYVIGADRANELVNNIFDPFHPAVLRLIKFTIESAKLNNIKVSVCGELASHSAATNLLIGLGVNELSVAPSSVLDLKNRVRESNYEKYSKIISKIKTIEEYYSLLEKIEPELVN